MPLPGRGNIHRIVRAGRCEQGGGPNASHLEEPHALVAGCAQIPVAARAHQPVRLHHQILHDRPGRPVIETHLLPREHGRLQRRERLTGLQGIRLGQPAVRVNHDPRRRGRRPVAMSIRDSGEQLANPRNKGRTQSHRVSTPRRERREQRPALIPAQRGHIGAIPRQQPDPSPGTALAVHRNPGSRQRIHVPQNRAARNLQSSRQFPGRETAVGTQQPDHRQQPIRPHGTEAVTRT